MREKKMKCGNWTWKLGKTLRTCLMNFGGFPREYFGRVGRTPKCGSGILERNDGKEASYKLRAMYEV